MSDNVQPSPAVKTAKSMQTRNGNETIIELAVGGRARLYPVSASLIDEVTSHVKDPEIPMWNNPDRPTDKHPEGRPEPNPNDPVYLDRLEDARRMRGIAAMDAMVMFGTDLIDGMPEDDSWIRKLKFMEKHDRLSLDGYDLDDPVDQEFLYKRYVAIDGNIIIKISEISGISGEELTRAENSFPSD